MTHATEIRLAFLRATLQGLRLTWPILSGLLLVQAGLGATIGLIEHWGAGPGVYFAFVTGLTIGYGDFAPTHPGTRMLAVLIGLIGVMVTAVLAAVAVSSLQAATGRHMVRE